MPQPDEFPVMTPAFAKGMRTPKGTKHTPTCRMSPSGKRAPLAPAKPWWTFNPEVLQADAERTAPREKTSAWYEALAAVPKLVPVMLCECRQPVNDGVPCIITQDEHLSTEHRGYNRTERRKRGERGGYAKSLRLRMGPAMFS